MFIWERIAYMFSGMNRVLIVMTFVLAVILGAYIWGRRIRLKVLVGRAFLETVICVLVMYTFFTPLHVETIGIVDTERYEIAGGESHNLYAKGKNEVVLHFTDGSEQVLPLDKLEIELRADISDSFLEVSTELVEEVWLHKTVERQEETYTLFLKNN